MVTIFRFEKEQLIVEVGGVRFGGQPGELPTVLAGSIFYEGHRVVSDPKKGEFDKARAEALINKQEELSDATAIPCLVQVFAQTPEAIFRYVDFVSSITDTPFLIDSTDSHTRIQAAKHVLEAGLGSRAIYNSLNVSVTEEEIASLKESGMACVVLAFNPKDQSTVKGRLEVLSTGAGILGRGLLQIAKEFTDKILLDVAVTPLGLGSGAAETSTYVMKAKLGFPVGCGVHNAVSAWEWLRNYRKQVPEGKEVFRVCDVSSSVIHVMCGGDFILYGPIENAPYVFPTVALADCFIAEAVKSELGTTPSEGHPFNKLVVK